MKYYFFIIISILLWSSVYSQNLQFTASTSHNNVKTGDRFQVEFKANGDIDNFTPPSNISSDFRVLSGPNQSSSMSWVNGKTSSSISYSYILMAIKEGSFTLNPASGLYNGKTYQTNSIEINVGKGVQVQSQSGSKKGSNKGVNPSDDIFIKASINKSKVYQGEQLIVSYKVYTKVNIAGAEPGDDTQLNGFWKQEVDLGQVTWKDEIISGFRWKVATIKKYVLFPQRSGDLEIDPFEMKFIAQKRVKSNSRSFFDQFFSQVENVEYNCKSKPVKIKVLPHPKPIPDSFAGAVGKLNMKVDVSSKQIKANEAINIKVKISGKGNIGLIEAVKLNFPSDFETYDPKIVDNIKTTKNGVSGSREFDYLVIPRHSGKFDLGPVIFSYFDPSSKKFKTESSNPIIIEVLKGNDSSEDNVTYSSNNKEDIQIVGHDIRFIHTSKLQLVNPNNSFYGSTLFYILLLTAPLLFVVALIFRDKIRIANSDIVGKKKKKASKVASKLLITAKQNLSTNNKNDFYEAISKALYGYISDKLNIPTSELNQTNIKEQLTTLKVSNSTITDLVETIDLCDMARFAPVSTSDQEVYNKAETIIDKIEEEIG